MSPLRLLRQVFGKSRTSAVRDCPSCVHLHTYWLVNCGVRMPNSLTEQGGECP